MPLEQGGLADKLGNRYEARWVAKQLLSLLNEEIRSVTIEAIGDDEQGVDLWVEENNGINQAQQCKARNASKEYWPISDLNSRGVLGNLKFQLYRDPTFQFALVSSVGSEVFKDICDFARRSNNNPEVFCQHKILAAGKEVNTCFNKFCAYLSFDPVNKADLKKAFEYLKRTYVHVYPDDQNSWQELLGRAGYLLTGKPETNIALLVNYAENNERLGSPIYADELRAYLAGLTIYPKRLSHDTRIAPAVNELETQFIESIRSLLIKNEPLDRLETAQLLEAIENNKNVIVHGAAGNGKSGVLYELIQQLQQKNISCLPIRLDRREPQNTAVQFGEQLGLPDSPAHCLAALAGDRQAVLILDQLDALRWTSAHTNNALDVCKELLRHVQVLRHAGLKITTVLSCRTYDLENDPEIKNWLSGSSSHKFERIEVNQLDQTTLQRIIGSSYATLSAKEIELLANPHNLSMWLELKKAGNAVSFASATQLISRFWESRRRSLNEQANITPEQLDSFLTPIIDDMEQKGKISSPRRIVTSHPRIYEALCSYGILQEEANRVSFCHQRYLDYLIADRLLLGIYQGSGKILDWLGDREQQSLFRREQLRQALVMLSEEDPHLFFSETKAILEAMSVRFHIKHLVLELIGQQETITEGLFDYCFSLFQDDFWKDHILETIFLGHMPYIQFLIERGIITKWLDSENDEIERALWFLRSVTEKIPDIVAKLLEPYLAKGGNWPVQILNTLEWRLSKDSERTFQLHLQLARMGYIVDFVDWKSFCDKHPLRTIEFLEAVISNWKINDDEGAIRPQKSRLEKWYDQDSNALNTAVTQYPAETWDMFVPHIDRLTSFETKQYDSRLKRWGKEPNYGQHHTDIARGIVELVMLAGRNLAVNKPDELIARTSLLENSLSPIIQEILTGVYVKLQATFAEVGIRWLLKDSSRFAIGHGYDEPEWQPAHRLIESLSKYCSDKLFRQLEQAIIEYHSPEEKQMAQYYLRGWREGHFGHYWGKAQYFLLPALAQERVQPQTKALLQVIKRTFSSYPEWRFLRSGKSSGGFVSSKLDQNLERISDRSWLEIVTSKRVDDGRYKKWKQNGPDNVLETSVRQFSRSLETIAKRYPQRFGELALHFPDNVPIAYISSVLDGLAQTQPGNEVPDNQKAVWQPASINTIERILSKFQASDDRETAMSFCSLISNRATENWSEATIARLIYYACNHPDLEPGKLNISCDQSADEASVQTLYQNTINCVRGNVARAIQRLLWHDSSLFEKLRPALEALIRDPHPVVRMAATEALLPVLNINKDLAVEWFCNACSEDVRVAAAHGGRQFFNYTVQSHYDMVKPVIQGMMGSSQEDVVTEGAIQVTARWIFHGHFESELQECRQGTLSQRKGVAKAAVMLFADKKHTALCQNLLLPLLNDPNKDVRNACCRMPQKTDFLYDDQFKPFLKEYVASKAFSDDPGQFIRVLKDTSGSLEPLSDAIFTICEVFSTSLKEKARDLRSRIPHDVSKSLSVLIRLYEQACSTENTDVANRCLDTMDMLFENRVGIIRELMKTIEQ